MFNRKIGLVFGGLITALLFLQYQLWFESGGIYDLLKLKKTLAQQVVLNDQLKKQNDVLAFNIVRSQQNHDATEARARDELGMIKKGETYYQIVHE